MFIIIKQKGKQDYKITKTRTSFSSIREKKTLNGKPHLCFNHNGSIKKKTTRESK